ncbi:mug86 [Candida theae]|uniref:Mug86 n=1 Tax=Candida theae TaxID=1198502 RepID=A0AAD5BJH9_9ASCO|nr:mug86 [Candida theae]KAI5968178.1 mug86 [Candida theae]
MSSVFSQNSATSKNPSTDVDDAGISRVHVHGDGGEFVTISGQKFYRHELMAAFGGSLNPGAAPYPKVNINPAPLGLCGFALTTFVLSLVNARAMGISIPKVVVSMACFYGGMVQLFAGLFEFVVGNTFGCTALTSYGAFWLSYAAIHIEAFGIGAAYEGSDQLTNAVSFFLLGWTIFTFMLLLNTVKSTWPFFLLFLFLFLTFLLLTVGDFTGILGVTRTGGIFGVITAIIAWYNAFAGTATSLNSYIVAHSLPMPSNNALKKHT